MNNNQLRNLIVDILQEADTISLGKVKYYSPQAEELLMGTAAVESALGYYIEQIKGPAKGIFQMEPTTEQDIFDNYLAYREDIRDVVQYFSDGMFDYGHEMRWNLAYQIIMCRVHYLRVPVPLPSSMDIEGQANYWKSFYNTSLGKGTTAKYLAAYNKYVLKGV